MDGIARRLVELNGRAALRLIRGFAERAERSGDDEAAEAWRGVEIQVQKELGATNDN
jgi:hypothetical protein